jgi:dimethyl sulfoxide reductase iron-sulfur subunit
MDERQQGEEPVPDGERRGLSRRRLLGGLGVAAAGMAAATVIPISQIPIAETSDKAHSQAAHATDGKRQWAFVIDLRRCDGCKACTDACQKEHYLPKDQEWIKVLKSTNDAGLNSYFVRICNMCENPPCLKVCPTAATFKRDDGVVLIDQNKCIGCRMCMVACPYEARYFNYNEPLKPKTPFANPMPEFPVPQQKGTVGKCILCVHNADKGKIPFCVEACTMDALYIADLNSDVMTNSSSQTYQMSKFLYDNDAFRYKEELNTSPRVWYVAGHGQNLEF